MILPLEASILATAVELARGGVEEFHGFELAKRLRDDEGRVGLTRVQRERSRLEKSTPGGAHREWRRAVVGEGSPARWLLVGGQMVFLYEVERQASEIRPTDDVDVPRMTPGPFRQTAPHDAVAPFEPGEYELPGTRGRRLLWQCSILAKLGPSPPTSSTRMRRSLGCRS